MNQNLRYLVNAALLAFVFGSLGYALLRGENSSTPDSTPRPLGLSVPVVEGVEPRWAVYFFYNDVYCDTCERLEGYAFEAVQKHFGDRLESGDITWRSFDMTTPQNEHYAIDFDLYSKSVVLIELHEGEEIRWKNLEKIWDLVDDEPAYIDYIQKTFNEFMDEAQ
jgi:hypothetical protein